MKQNTAKKTPTIITGITHSKKNSNIAITFNFKIKNRRSSQMAGAEKTM